MTITVGETIPEGTFKYIPHTPELENSVSIFLKKKKSAIQR